MLRLYMDVHVKTAITAGARRRGIDAVTAQEDGATRLEDVPLLDRATALGRVLFSQDDDLLAIAKARQTQGVFFAGLIYGHQLAATIGK
jgi:predicted nuclease of predicted toxin-antitoxin system